MNEKEIIEYIKREGWEISKQGSIITIETPTKKYTKENGLIHPVKIHKEHYRDATSDQERYYHLKKYHDLLWPEELDTWNHWDERRFEAHCEQWRFIGHASGANTGKSRTAAKLGILFWFSAPRKNAVVVASTTLTALDTRIWGYVMDFVKKMRVKLPYTYLSSPNQQIIPKDENVVRGEVKSKRHSMRTMAAPVGTDEDAIRNYIGQHPEGKLMLILDEAPDLEPVILNTVANLEAGGDLDGKLELHAIGNSASPADLHGMICMPEGRKFEDIDINKEFKWKTVHRKGVCLYFSPYDSPAIHEPNPEKRTRLEKIFQTTAKIAQAKADYGENSVQFWRMILGFWSQNSSKLQVFVDEPFLKEYGTLRSSLWSGLYPLRKVAGFDAAFSTGGDKCILRIGVMGHDIFGQMVLDFRDKELLFDIPMSAKGPSIEIQVADAAIEILQAHNMSLEDVAIDSTGQGRVLAEYIRSRAKEKHSINWGSAIKIYHARSGTGINTKGTDILVYTPTVLWDNMREYMNTKQICGLDSKAVYQFSTRLLVFNEKTKKRELESKKEYKSRMNAITKGSAGSPDEADASALCLLTAILRYGFHKEMVKALPETPRTFLEEKLLYHAIGSMQQQSAVAAAIKSPHVPKAGYTGGGVRGYGGRR